VGLLLLVMNTKAQNEPDSIHKNEFSFNVLPVITVISGGSTGASANFNLSYKRYLKNNYVLRSAFVFYPAVNNRNDDGIAQYNRTIDTLNVFQTRMNSGKRWQLNLGFEKLFYTKRMMHGFGADFSFANENNASINHFWWEPKSTQAVAGYQMYTNDNFKVNKIDSLSYSSTENKVGFGTQLFYSARFRMTKRLYLSSTFGPSLMVYSTTVNSSKIQNAGYNNLKFINIDFNVILSDISIAYRF